LLALDPLLPCLLYYTSLYIHKREIRGKRGETTPNAKKGGGMAFRDTYPH
jgi:hypothetical protein